MKGKRKMKMASTIKVPSVSRPKKLEKRGEVGGRESDETAPLFRLGRDRVEFERCCLTRRRGGAEKHAENIFSGLVSELARLRRKVKTCERGDSGDRTASQRGSRWGGRLTKTARGGYRSWSGAFQCWQGEGRHGPKDFCELPAPPADCSVRVGIAWSSRDAA